MLVSDRTYVFVHYFDNDDKLPTDSDKTDDYGLYEKYDHLQGSEWFYGVPPEDRIPESDYYDSDYHED